jgi:hypothetical protein
MANVQNYLEAEVKEENEEKKIDIDNHFLPAASSCEEDQLARSV